MKPFDFLNKEIWQTQLAALPKWKASIYRFLRIILLTHRGFAKSQIQQGASSLTYYSLLAMVPIIALLIGIARGFAFENTLQEWLLTQFSDQKEIVQRIFTFAKESLEQANGGLIAGIGVAILIWSAIKILTNIEFVMNQIWEVQKGRPLAKRFTDYLAMLFLAPIIIFLISGLSGYLSALFSAISKGKVFSHFIPFLIPILSLITISLTALLFTFLYIFIPNTRVRFIPALIAGVFTAFTYQMLQWVYFYFQIGVSSYNAIYGTFAAFPLFLIWLHLSWVIILIGAKLCFSLQNVDAYEFYSENLHLSHQFQMLCSLRITHLCVHSMLEEQPPPTAIEISNHLSIPILFARQSIYQLVQANVLIEAKREKDQEICYQPARSLDRLTIKSVIDKINESGGSIPFPASIDLSQILDSLKQFGEMIEKSDANLLLKDIPYEKKL